MTWSSYLRASSVEGEGPKVGTWNTSRHCPLQLLCASLFWPGMDSDIEEFCRNCETCVRLQPLRRDTPRKPTPLPEHCWDKCAIDLVGPFPGQIYILTLVDYRSKWPEATILKGTTTQKIIFVLTEIFARFGNPKVLLSDNGPQFTSEEFKIFFKLNGIHKFMLEHSIRAANLMATCGPKSFLTFYNSTDPLLVPGLA